MGAFVLGIVVGVIVAITIYLIGSMWWSIRAERRKHPQKTWQSFGLSLAFCILFLTSWVAHGAAEWQVFTDEQRDHNRPVTVGDFTAEFAQSTLENWQSEFLQLFSFVVMSALLIHRGSAESKDSDDRIEETLKRIEQKLETS
jgi:heme A synthase